MARSFTADTDEINIGAASAIDITGDITVAMWIKNGATAREGHIIGAYNAASPFNGWAVAAEATTDFFKYWSNGNGAWVNSSTALGTAWEHRAMVISGTGAGAGTFYLNLVSDGTFSQTSPSSYTGTKMIGTRSDSGVAQTFDGILAHLCVWNVALTLDELRSHRNGRIPRPGSLKGFWPLYGAATEPDLSGNANNGTVTGTAIVDHAPIGPTFGWASGWFGAFTAAPPPGGAPAPEAGGQPFHRRFWGIPGHAGYSIK